MAFSENPNLDDNDQWEQLLQRAFGDAEPEPITENPVTEAAPLPEPLAEPESSAEPPLPAPKKRLLWLLLPVAAVLIAAVLFLFLSKPKIAPELKMCKDTLEQWQSRERYYIVEQMEFRGDDLSTPSTLHHFRKGNDQLYVSIYYHIDEYAIVHTSMYGIMRKNGNFYEVNTPYSLVDLPNWEPSKWVGQCPNPWPISFRWEDSKILTHHTEYHESGSVSTVMVTFQDSAAESRFSSDLPCNAVFRFSEDGNAVSITLIIIGISEDNTTGLQAFTYTLQEVSPDLIDSAFQNPPTRLPILYPNGKRLSP